mmetsp:Transcript_21591/g.50818  ORF Transcript_21591/g.50818 Transcript_21591/m.50818 type:complete len:266 (+) Transcript_21591:677-1474(+)
MGANAERVHLMPLGVERVQSVLVDVVGCNDLVVAHPIDAELFFCILEHFAGLLGQVRQVSTVQPNSGRLVPDLDQRPRSAEEVRHTRLKGIVGIHKSKKVVWEGLGVANESRQFAFGCTFDTHGASGLEDQRDKRDFLAFRRHDVGRADVIQTGEGLDIGVSVRALHGNAEHVASQKIAGAVETPHVGVTRGSHCSIGPLGTTKSKLQQSLFRAGSNTHPRCIGCDQRGVVDNIEECRLQKLTDCEGSLHAKQGNSRECHGSFSH